MYFKFWPMKNIFWKLQANESLIMACLQSYIELLSQNPAFFLIKDSLHKRLNSH